MSKLPKAVRARALIQSLQEGTVRKVSVTRPNKTLMITVRLPNGQTVVVMEWPM